MLYATLRPLSTSLQLQSTQIGRSCPTARFSTTQRLSPFQPLLRSSNAGRLSYKPIRIQRTLPTSRQLGRSLDSHSVRGVHSQIRNKGQISVERAAERFSKSLGLESRGLSWRGESCFRRSNQSSQLRASQTVDKSEDVLTNKKTDSPALKRQNGAQNGVQNGAKRSTQSIPETSTPPPPAEDKPSGSLLGAVALITGTSVGAGILALPAVTAPAGFVPATSIMVACWSFLVGEALLLAEVNVELLKQVAGQTRGSDVLSLRTMAQKTLGPTGGAAATLAYVFLTYTLLTAYVAKSADVLSLLLGLPTPWSGVAFVGFFGALLLVGGTVFTDYLNQAATATMLVLFLVMVGGGSFFADWSILEQADWGAAPAAVPIIFLSLVYHDLTPVICSYLGGDIRRIRQAIILGSLVPLLMFVSCNAVALAISPVTGGGDPLNIMIRLGGPGPAAMIEAFSLLAITTSFIGTILGATEFALEQFGGLQLAGKQAPPVGRPSSRVSSIDGQSPSEGKVLSKEGLKPKTSPSKVRPQEGVDDAFVQEEIDRLQKRVNEKLQQWDSRFKRDQGSGQNGNGYRGGVLKVDKLARRQNNLEGQPSLVNTVNSTGGLVAGDSGTKSRIIESRVGGSLDASNRKPSNNRSSTSKSTIKTRSGQSLDRQDAANGGLWSKEAPQTGTSNWALRAGAFFVVLVPPVAVASQYPDAFIQASNIAGAYGMTTLYGFFPVAMAWSMRSKVKRWKSDSTKLVDYRVLVPGGRLTLVLMGLCAAGIMAGQASLDSKLAAGALTDLLTIAEPALEAIQQAASQAVGAFGDVSRQVQTWEDGFEMLQNGKASVQTAVEGLADHTKELQDSIRRLTQERASQAVSALADLRGQVQNWGEGSEVLQSAEHLVQTAVEELAGNALGLQDSVGSLMQEGTSQVGKALADGRAQVQNWGDGSEVLRSAEHSVQTAVAELADLDSLRSLMQEGASQAVSALEELSAQVQTWEDGLEVLRSAERSLQSAVAGSADLDSLRGLIQEGASQAVNASAEVAAQVQSWVEGSEGLEVAKHSVQTAIDGVADLSQRLHLQEAAQGLVEKAVSLRRQKVVGQ